MVQRIAILLTFMPLWAAAQLSCPPVNFLTARTLNLKPSATSHIDVVRQIDGSYSGFEVADTAPYRTLAVTPHFEQKFGACLPHAVPSMLSGSPIANSPGAGSQSQVAMSLPAGNYFAASISGDTYTVHFDVFDSLHNLVSENNFSSLDKDTLEYTNEMFESLTLVDLNQDGNLDLIAVFEGPYSNSYHQGGIWIFLGNGNGTFQPGKQQVLGIRAQILPVQSIAVADVNGDGKPDLLFAAPYGGALLLAFGNGDGTFNSQTIPVSITGSFLSQVSVTMADLNQDGKMDIVLSPAQQGLNTSAIAVALGKGDGTFQPAVQFAVSAAPVGVSTASVAIGDLNGDGIPDIATASGTILFGDGKGGFPTRTDYASLATGSVMIGDVDGDGYADIIFGNGNPSFLSGSANDPSSTILFGSGGGAFTGAPVNGMTLALNSSDPFVAADFNGDGIPDIALANTTMGSSKLTVLAGKGDGRFSAGNTNAITLPASGIYAAAADFNRDGKADLAIILSGGGIQIFLGNGDGTFRAPLTLSTAANNFNLLASPDVNGDGIPDLAAWNSSTISVWLGKGDGTFSSPTFDLAVASPAVAFGDFNGDGKMDIAITNAASTNLNVLLGKGDGTFPNSVTTVLPAAALGSPGNVGGNNFNTLTAADFDGDGRLDVAVIVGTYAGPTFPAGLQLAVLSGQGNGGFSALHLTPVLITSAVSVDVNRDGIPDLVGNLNAGFSTGSGLGVLLGNGDGTFQPGALLEQGGGAITVADFNRDGIPDVAEVNVSGFATFLNLSQAPAALSVVSAASFAAGPLAPNSIATAFGEHMAPGTAAASDSLMTSLLGITVNILDSTGTNRAAPLFFVSPGQINFLVPAQSALGTATISVSGTGLTKPLTAEVQIAAIAPAIFTEGSNIAAGYVTQVAIGGAQTILPIYTVVSGVVVPSPINLARPGQVYLVLFGTGFDSPAGGTTVATVQGAFGAVTYSGSQLGYTGLDQINLLIPSVLAGTGVASVSMSVGGKTSNTVLVTLQ